jgi:hypothetical protein
MKTKGFEYQLLSKFMGKWNTTGTIPASDKSPEIKISGTDTYEWLPGGYFLLHKVDVLMGNDRNETFEVIGFDEHENHYTMQHYDNKGNSGLMIASCKDGVWTFLGENLKFTGGFKNQDNEFSGIWERSTDGQSWEHLMEIRLFKTS